MTDHEYLELLGPTPPDTDHWNRVWRAVMLAPTIATCEALLSGEDVPVTALDPKWVRRFGLR